MDNKQLVLSTLQTSDTPLKSGEISDITGIDKKEISKFISSLKKEGLIESPKRCYYSPKPQ